MHARLDCNSMERQSRHVIHVRLMKHYYPVLQTSSKYEARGYIMEHFFDPTSPGSRGPVSPFLKFSSRINSCFTSGKNQERCVVGYA